MPRLDRGVPEQAPHEGSHQGGAFKGETRLGLVGRGLNPGDDPVAVLNEFYPALVIYRDNSAIDFSPQAMGIWIGL